MPAGAPPPVAAIWSVVTPVSTAVEPAGWQLSKAALQVYLKHTCTLLPLQLTAPVAMAVALQMTSVPVNLEACLQASGWLATILQALTKSHMAALLHPDKPLTSTLQKTTKVDTWKLNCTVGTSRGSLASAPAIPVSKYQHLSCSQVCSRDLLCGHTCGKPCHGGSTCPPCTRLCSAKCGHGQCKGLCTDLCAPCAEPCRWHCQHQVSLFHLMLRHVPQLPLGWQYEAARFGEAKFGLISKAAAFPHCAE